MQDRDFIHCTYRVLLDVVRRGLSIACRYLLITFLFPNYGGALVAQ